MKANDVSKTISMAKGIQKNIVQLKSKKGPSLLSVLNFSQLQVIFQVSNETTL